MVGRGGHHDRARRGRDERWRDGRRHPAVRRPHALTCTGAPTSARRRSVRSVTHPQVTVVGADELDLLGGLFAHDRTTRSCWCTAFCTSRSRFALGWVTGRNREHLATVARDGAPLGVVVTVAGAAVGWAACGPRARYRAAEAGRSSLLAALDRAGDDGVWFVPCLYVRPDHRGRGLTETLVRAALDLAREHGARAVEAWPLSTVRADLAHVGRETVFTAAGFRPLERPGEDRVLVRHELAD
ncbi:GNAT family N-acetyltransferase [Geodermatophilaceae bacterium NBWT11]|nr:GNAT family N-acetyltransferase [Geodermatophilaceae bacterium NBWT11]